MAHLKASRPQNCCCFRFSSG